MPGPHLHLDADASSEPLYRALLNRGHDVTRTPNDWIEQDATDEAQLLGATARGRCIVTFNVRHVVPLAQRYPEHGGIILAARRRMGLSELISALDHLLTEIDAADWPGQVRWLADWRRAPSPDS
jgi:Domain of unknown function (DUF5615)